MQVTQYELLRERLILEGDLKRQLRNQALGDQGEEWFNQQIRAYLPDDWVLLEDLWLSVGGHQTQIDSLILTPREWWNINVKNHQTTYTYQGGQWLNGQGQVFTKMYNQIRRLEDTLIELSRQVLGPPRDLNLRSSVVMVHPQGRVLVEQLDPSDPEEPEIPTSHWQGFVRQLVSLVEEHQVLKWHHELDRRMTYEFFDPAVMAQAIQAYAIDRPDYAKTYPVTPSDLVARARPGVVCPSCRQFYPRPGHKFFTCACGHQELKSTAIIRTACEFMKMTDIPQITTGELVKFMGGVVSDRAIRKTLCSNFTSCGKGRSAYYRLRI